MYSKGEVSILNTNGFRVGGFRLMSNPVYSKKNDIILPHKTRLDAF